MCSVWKKKKSYYSHHEISILMRYCENEPPPHSCICLAHLVEAQREHPEHFIQKWKIPNHDTHSVVMSLRGVEAPLQLYNSKGASKSVKEQHEAWYDDVRAITSDRVTNEEDQMPSRTSRHWLRSSWVAQLYQNAPSAN